MTPELELLIRAATPLIYFVTEEEDLFLSKFKDFMGERVTNVKVHSPTTGLVPITSYLQDWSTRAHAADSGTANIHDALIAIYKDPTPAKGKGGKYYVLLDPEVNLPDAHIQRRILNILHQVHNNTDSIKVLICVSNRRIIPQKLSRYAEVVYDPGLSQDDITTKVLTTCAALRNLEPPPSPERLFQGLTSFEIRAAIIQAFKQTRSADPKVLTEYRFKQLRKSDLIQYIDASEYTLDHVGGVGRFKTWVQQTKAAWSPAGRAFGLEPPKGVLAVGVWGTGKSLSIKALGNAWGLPILGLEMGRLRAQLVGEAEANVYRALKIIESVAPCLVWIDEAEKSLSGGQSSAASDAGTTSRMIGILSTWLQETKAPVCLAMTANSLKTLPVEFINRMDERWFFDLPSREDRIDILKIHLAKRSLNPAAYNLALLAENAEAMVGREIEQCLKASLTLSFVAGRPTLDEEIFAAELARKPRIVRTMVDEIRETLDWVGFDPNVDDGVRARFAADPKGPDRKFAVG